MRAAAFRANPALARDTETSAVSRLVEIGVLWDQRVPVQTVRLLAVVVAATTHVLNMSDALKVVRTHATRIPAQMVRNQIRVSHSSHKAVQVNIRAARDVNLCVAASVQTSLPLPATVRLSNKVGAVETDPLWDAKNRHGGVIRVGQQKSISEFGKFLWVEPDIVFEERD